jgi:hypothetical protein
MMNVKGIVRFLVSEEFPPLHFSTLC